MLLQRMRILSLGLLLTLAACEQGARVPWDLLGSGPASDTGPTLSLTTDAPSYVIPRAAITIRLTNRSTARLGYDLCRASIDRFTEEDWLPVQMTLEEVCRGDPRTLFPGQAATYSFRTDPMMRRGQYRIRAELTDARSGARVQALSNSFKLESHD